MNTLSITRRRLPSLLILLAAAVCAHAQTPVGGQAVESTVGKTYSAATGEGGMTLAQIAALPETVAPFAVPFKEWNANELAGKPRIAVPSYGVSFIRSAEAFASTAGAGGFLSSSRRAAKYQTVLGGVKDELFPQLAEEAYADLVKRLAAAGFDVVRPDDFRAALEASDIWIEGNKSQGSRKLDGRADKGWTVFGAGAAPLLKGASMDFALTGPGASMGAVQNAGVTVNAITLHPLLVLDYIAIDSSGNNTFARNASVAANTAFSISPASRVDFGYKEKKGPGTGYGGALTLEGAVASNEPFAVIAETEDRSDNVVVHNALALIGFGSVYKQSKAFTVEAVEKRYVALARAAYSGFNQAIVDQIRKARAGGMAPQQAASAS